MKDDAKSAIQRLLAANQSWRERLLAEDDQAFTRHTAGQQPPFFWIGCSDSRVPTSDIAGLERGDAFVHRNIANQAKLSDTSVQAALAFAIENLGVQHVVVCGHYGCGGVALAADLPAAKVDSKLRDWVTPIHSLCQKHADTLDALEGEKKLRKLVELNVQKQVDNICLHKTVLACWANGKPLTVHGMVYDLANGRLHDLDIARSGA